MKHQTVVNCNDRPLTIVLSCVDSDLELRLAKKLNEAGYSVVEVEMNSWMVLHRIFQFHASLLVLQTNTGHLYEKEMEYCRLLHCKVLLLETHAESAFLPGDRSAADARMTLPVDPDSVLGMIQCLFYDSRSAERDRLTLEQLLDNWQVTRRQPNRRMMEQGILLTVEHPHWAQHITKDIYPRLAQRNHLTVTAVEQRLRRAILRIYLYGQDEVFRSLFGLRRPTNSQFFSQIARYLIHSDEEDIFQQEQAE